MQHICRVIKLFEFYLPRKKEQQTKAKAFRSPANQALIVCDAHASFPNRCSLVLLLCVLREQWISATGRGWEQRIKKACSFQNNFFFSIQYALKPWLYAKHILFSSTRKRNERWRWTWWWTWRVFIEPDICLFMFVFCLRVESGIPYTNISFEKCCLGCCCHHCRCCAVPRTRFSAMEIIFIL